LRLDIDRAIDEVARQLTAGEPGGAFTARVMARIGRGESRRMWPTRLMAPIPIAAMIIVLVAFWSYRGYRSPDRLALRPAPAPSPLRRASPELTQTASERRPEKLALPSGPGRARPMQPSEVGALAPPPLRVPSIALAPIDRGDSIRLEQLEPIAPIDLAPLPVEPPNQEPGFGIWDSGFANQEPRTVNREP